MAYLTDKISNLIERKGPFLSLYLNTEAAKEDAPKEIDIRWRVFRRELAESGAPDVLLEQIDGIVDGAYRSGDGLVVFAAQDEVVLQENLSHPIDDSASWGKLPQVLPLLEWIQERPGYAVALVDRTGAEIHVRSSVKPDWEEHVEGDDNPIQRVSPGGWSQKGFQERAENLWEKNAKRVADALAEVVRRESVELVILSGDVRAIGFLKEHLPKLEAEVVDMDLEAHSIEDLSDELEKMMSAYVAKSTDELLDKFQEERGQNDLAVEGYEATCEVLREARVETLFAPRDPGERNAYFVGGLKPIPVAASQQTLADLNIGEVWAAPSVDVLVASALSGDSRVRVIPHLPADIAPQGGVGALLRFDYSDPNNEKQENENGSEDKPRDEDEEADEAAEESFPASDPPAW